MNSPEVPVNRTLVGLLAIVCAALGVVTWGLSGDEGASMWPGAFIRSSLILGAFWLALPTPKREAAWARVSIWKVVGVTAAIVVIARSRVPLKILVPALIVGCVALMILRPRSRTRPTRSH